jgi:hypothetical protein
VAPAWDGSTWWGYFVANYSSRGVSEIKRIPLAGGPATIVPTGPGPINRLSTRHAATGCVSCVPAINGTDLPAYAGDGDLAYDSGYLYWSDGNSLWRMPATGGTPQPLASGQLSAHFAIAGGYIYYGNGDAVWRVPAATPSSLTPPQGLVNSSSTVTAIALDTSGSTPTLYWGAAGGEIDSTPVGSGNHVDVRVSHFRGPVSNMSVDDGFVLFLECGSGCEAFRAPTADSDWWKGDADWIFGHRGFDYLNCINGYGCSLPSPGFDAGYREEPITSGDTIARDIVGDHTYMFYGDSDVLDRYDYDF